jgi:hypothetical protein
MLDDNRNAVLSGRWTEKSAGGCHLHDKAFEQKPEKFTWNHNPKFHLKLETNQNTWVKITLQRPEKVWKKQIGMDLVGCMIGFYVYSANSELCKENILNHRVGDQNGMSQQEIKFVPWNEISETLELAYNPDGYMIMCATYDP